MHPHPEAVVTKPRQPVRTFVRFFALIKPYWHLMLLVILLDLVTSPFPVIEAMVTKIIADTVLLNAAAPLGERFESFLWLTLALVGLRTIRNTVVGDWFDGACLTGFYGMFMGIKVRLGLRKRLYSHLHRLPMSFFQQRAIGEHGYRMLSDTGPAFLFGPDAVALATDIVPGLVKIANQTILAITYLAVVTPDLAVLVVLYVIPKAFFTHYLTAFTQRRLFLERDRAQHVPSVLRDSIAGAKTVKCFGQQMQMRRRYATVLFRALRRSIAYHWWDQARTMVLRIIDLGFSVSLFGYIGWKAIQGHYSVGEYLAIHTIVVGIPTPLMTAVNMVQAIRMNLIFGERILQTLDVPATNVDKPNAVPMPVVKGRIELEHVKFSYPDGTQVLRDLNLTIEPGKSLAIVGPSGQGKTTLLYLLLRICRPDSGTVRVDGVDLNDVRLGDLLKKTGVVMQDTHIFLGDLRHNLKYACPLARQEDIEEAAQIADIHDFIAALPDGYDTEAREGARMSGGQKQRLGIARALVGRPPILMFDEPTSSLDSRTEMEVWRAMERAMEGRTSLIITHRLPTARGADRIAVLNAGVIAEHGTHDELLARGGLYAEMWRKQFHMEREGDPA